MPELPEVETMVRGLRPFVQGRTVTAVRRCRCRCRPISTTPGFRQLARRMAGSTVTAVNRLAKRIVLQLSSGERLVIEPRMTGLMSVADPPDREHLRIRWDLDSADRSDPGCVWFWDRRGLGTVRLYRPEEFATAFAADRIGPDALDMTANDWRDRCGRTRRAIKVALLDQKLVAGIGNLYASEILHAARIHPAAPADQLSEGQLGRMNVAVNTVLAAAIRCEGSTLSDGTYRNALNQNGGYQNEHRVYQKSGQLCPTCRRAKIRRIVQAQRSTFYCGRCQR